VSGHWTEVNGHIRLKKSDLAAWWWSGRRPSAHPLHEVALRQGPLREAALHEVTLREVGLREAALYELALREAAPPGRMPAVE
jgi:hypothetical protein